MAPRRARPTPRRRFPARGCGHLAATVEMCPFRMPVDAAMIDEAQMLGDRDRGAAWTAAIMGAPAREVFVLGAPESAATVRRIARLCGDPLEEVELRKPVLVNGLLREFVEQATGATGQTPWSYAGGAG